MPNCFSHMCRDFEIVLFCRFVRFTCLRGLLDRKHASAT